MLAECLLPAEELTFCSVSLREGYDYGDLPGYNPPAPSPEPIASLEEVLPHPD
jgi:hypothetical protein